MRDERRKDPTPEPGAALLMFQDRNDMALMTATMESLGIAPIRRFPPSPSMMRSVVCAIFDDSAGSSLHALTLSRDLPGLPIIFAIRGEPQSSVHTSLAKFGCLVRFPPAPDTLKLLLD